MKHKVLFSYAGVATQILIQNSNLTILFDVGDGIIRDLLKEEIIFPLITPLHIFITHGHYDHTGGLFSLLGFLRMIGQTLPVHVYFPVNSTEINGILDLFFKTYKNTIPFELKIFKLDQHETIFLDKNVKILSYPMKHGGSTLMHGTLSEIPSYGYAIIDKKEKILAYTGDTEMNGNLIKLIKNSSHAYIEATNSENKKTSYHLNVNKAQELGKLAMNFTLIHTRYDSR